MNGGLVTVDRLGGLRGLQFKRGAGFDLRRMGRAEIHRISEIKWDEERQRWFVLFLRGELAEKPLTILLAIDARMRLEVNDVLGTAPDPETGVLYFTDYDDAVAAEVACVQGLRYHKGYSLA